MPQIAIRPDRCAAIAGATGLVGSFCLNYLLESPRYHTVLALSRRQPPADAERLRWVQTDFTDLEPAAERVDDVFCCLGTTMRAAGSRAQFRVVDHDYPVAVARWAARAGASHFGLVSSLGASTAAWSFYLRVKGEAERDAAASGVPSVVVYRPSLLLGSRRESRPGEEIGKRVARVLDPLLRGPLSRYRAVEASQVARAMTLLAASAPFGVHVVPSDVIQRIAPVAS